MSIKTPQSEFWKNPRSSPEGIEPPPEAYRTAADPSYWSELDELSLYLVDLLKRYLAPPATVLEPGCGSGRNLSHFIEAGYEAIGIEINPDALSVASEKFGLDRQIVIGSVEDLIPVLEADAIVTQGFLMHLPDVPSSEEVFDHIAANASHLILTNEIEDRPFLPDYRFMRNYGEVFERRGWTQIHRQRPELESIDVSHSWTRIFIREDRKLEPGQWINSIPH
jgi:SAM-dependent methyltransferase